MSRDNRETVFLENPGQSLGTAALTHKAILNTLSTEKTRKRFWKLNNGITAICTSLDPMGDAAYGVTNFKIVNGRQTAYALESSPDPIDNVLLLMTIHEAADDEERNQISEATNTQNPIRPEDLVTNYPEMTDLALQCKSGFPEFYFERQSKGFKSSKKSTQNRVTRRRVMGKSGAVRSYCAYAENPADATMPDKALFSVIGGPGYYERVFKDRKIRDLIAPHILMQSLEELHRAWCRELDDSPSDELARKKGIISKAPVRHFILKFIFESMMGISGDERESVKDSMIDDFRRLGRHDPIPDRLMEVARAGCDTFMASFDAGMGETWPEGLVKRIRGAKRGAPVSDRPTPYDIAQSLQQNGARLLPYLLDMRGHIISQVKSDAVRQALLAFVPGDRGAA